MKFFNRRKNMNNMISEMENIEPENKPAKIEAPKIEQPKSHNVIANAKDELINSVIMSNKEFGSLLNIIDEYDNLIAEPIGEEPRNPEHDNRHYEISKIIEGEDNFGRPLDKYEVIAKYENNRTDPILSFNDEFKPIICALWLTQWKWC